MTKKINVAKGFQTAVNIAYDLNSDDKIRGFIPTQSSLDVIEDILLSTATGTQQRARILIGAYGRGKSHIILVLLAFLAGRDEALFNTLLAKMKRNNPPLYEFALSYIRGGQRLLPVIIRGSSTSLTASFLSALQLTLSDEGLSDIMPETHFQAAIKTIETWRTSFPNTYKQLASLLTFPIDDFVLRLKEYDVNAYEHFAEIYPQLTSGSTFNPLLGFDIVELYESVTRGVKEKGYDGIFVVYDEFSKYLESSIANASISDIKLLQDFAEKCDRSGDLQMHLLLICHKDIANYIDTNLPKERVDGWRGVSGRFKHINLHNNYVQMYEIISEVIKKENRFWKQYKRENKEQFNDLVRRFTDNRLLDANNKVEVELAIYGCYPLHPISTFILPRLSEKVAQNERTLFTFLSAEDKYTLYAFLTSADGEFPLLTPDYLYDYFEPLLRKEPYTSEAHKIYKLTSSVLQKVAEGSLEAKILKTIALIYLVEQFEKLPPIVNIISDTFRDSVTDVKVINDALRILIEKDCIVYLKRSNNYLKIKESSGVDIPAKISDYIESNRAALRVKDILNNSAFDSFMYPTRYNDEFEITRYFDFLFIESKDFWEVDDWSRRIEHISADGVVYAIIPQNAGEIKKLRTALLDASCNAERVIFIIPNSYYDIEKIALEYEAVRNLRSQTENDELLADEYDIYLDDLAEVLGGYINTFARPENGGASYYYGGKQCKISRRSQLSEKISEICERIFYKTPIINNESINKNSLPTQALNSRTKLLTGLLATELTPNLGLTGTGQEVSIMRSTLIQTGILVNLEDKPLLNLEPGDGNVKGMLRVIRKFFQSASNNGGSTFATLYNELILPEHGIGLKRGLIPIYVAAVLSFDKQKLVIKYKDNEVRITPDLLTDINESPEDYSVILEDWNEDKAAYISGLRDIFGEYVSEREKTYNGFAYVLLAMNRWYMNLPKYAKELEKNYEGNGKFRIIDTRRKKFINSLKQLDGNPREYLIEKVFAIFGKQEVLSNVLPLIREIKADWDNAVPELLKTLIKDVKVIFSKKDVRSSLTSAIKDWYETLSPNTLQYLFSSNENRILSLMATVSNDESAFIQRLAKAVTSLRIEDWDAKMIELFLNDLKTFKKTVEEYDGHKYSDAKQNSDMYKVSFALENGIEVTKTFSKVTYSNKAKLLLSDLANSLDEMGESISEQEKRQVLMELLEKIMLDTRNRHE
ncbi:hypothetical protein X793_03835 [Dehalococcoides mccartyi CG4]|nr:hypothetical protein X793_03835 [Dehalococcoides mccartyi CG4]